MGTMEQIYFEWNVKERPEDFIVKEVAEYEKAENGRFFLYLLIKRNLNTKEITGKYRLWYAGLKDKNALTFQYVSSPKFLGETVFERIDRETFFSLIYIGRIKRNIKIGFLKGNRFSIRLKGHILEEKDWFINYFDIQRTARNSDKGRKLLKTIPAGTRWKQLKWLDNFYIDAYLSRLWNKALYLMLTDRFEGKLVVEQKTSFFFPYTDFDALFNSFPKFLPILGYKVKLNSLEESVYREVLRGEGFSLEEITEKLKDLRIKGDYRKTFLKAENLYTKDGRLYFFLPKGAYATMYLKSIFVR